MIYCLYWNKYYNTKKFWISTIKNIKGYYKDWVYIRKGLDNGLKFKGIVKCNSFYHYIYTGYWLNKEFMTRCYLRNASSKNKSILTNNTCDNNKENINENINENMDENINENINEHMDENMNQNINEHMDENMNQNINEHMDGNMDKNMNENINEHMDGNMDENIDENMDEHTNENMNENIDENIMSTDDKIGEYSDKINNKYNQECEFRGLIAGLGNCSTKYKKYQMVISLGYDNNKFINLHLNKKRDLSKFKQVIGKGYMVNSNLPHIVATKMILL